MKRTILLFLFSSLLVFSSCTESVYPIQLPSQGGQLSERSSVKIGYREEGNVKLIPVRINGVAMDMIVDTGASGILISQAEYQTLRSSGSISPSDHIGKALFQVADGRIVEEDVVLLRKVEISDRIILENVQAGVSRNLEAPLLLGNNVLNEFSVIEIDNDNRTINFRRR